MGLELSLSSLYSAGEGVLGGGQTEGGRFLVQVPAREPLWILSIVRTRCIPGLAELFRRSPELAPIEEPIEA